MSVKQLSDFFSDKQLELLRTRFWWVADPARPFLLKLARDDDSMLLQLTDLRQLWVCRLTSAVLLEQKLKFAKALEIKDGKHLLSLFDGLLNGTDREASYTFTENAGEAQFVFAKRLNIYDFSWTFKLTRVACNAVELVCRQLLTPLATILEAQTQRIEVLRRRFEASQKEHIRKMSEMERTLYKSPLKEDQEDWKLLLPKVEGKMLHLHSFDTVSKFFYQSYMLGETLKEKEKEEPVLVNFGRSMPRRFIEIAVEQSEQTLARNLEKERRKMKKDKQIDFI